MTCVPLNSIPEIICQILFPLFNFLFASRILLEKSRIFLQREERFMLSFFAIGLFFNVSYFTWVIINFEGNHSDGSNFLELVGIFINTVIIWLELLSILYSVALAIGGVRETRKRWFKCTLWIYCISPITIFFYVAITFSLPVILFILFIQLQKIKEDVDDNILIQQENQANTIKRRKKHLKLLIVMGFMASVTYYFRFVIVRAKLYSDYENGSFQCNIQRIILTIDIAVIQSFYFVLIRDYQSRIQIREEEKNVMVKRTSSRIDNNHNNRSSANIVNSGNNIYNTDRDVIGRAPTISSLPSWLLPTIATSNLQLGQKYLSPENWSITIRNFIRLAVTIMQTDTWSALAEAKGGEDCITTHDVNSHFTIPWTEGTGSSLALLLDPNPGRVQIMLSHSWSGSFKQTLTAIITLVTIHRFPLETTIFFCAFCQYQPDDGVENGLSVKEQLELDPFGQIIRSNPEFGLFAIHTTLSEIYTRLWCVDEVHEAHQAKIEMTGLFDPSSWSLSKFRKQIHIKTEEATCSVKEDEINLTNKIQSKGGFDVLNKAVSSFRKKATKDLGAAKTYKSQFGSSWDVNIFDHMINEGASLIIHSNRKNIIDDEESGNIEVVQISSE